MVPLVRVQLPLATLLPNIKQKAGQLNVLLFVFYATTTRSATLFIIYNKRSDFGIEVKAVERLNQLTKELKGDANDKTHSWFHLVKGKKELHDNVDIELIISLIKTLEKEVGL